MEAKKPGYSPLHDSKASRVKPLSMDTCLKRTPLNSSLSPNGHLCKTDVSANRTPRVTTDTVVNLILISSTLETILEYNFFSGTLMNDREFS